MPTIRFLNGPRQNQCITIHGGEVCGRDANVEIQIMAPGISRRHCQLVIEDGEVLVCDLGSMNHTYVNNEAITIFALQPSDTVSIGGIHFQFNNDDVVIDEPEDDEPNVADSMEAVFYFDDSLSSQSVELELNTEKDVINALERRLKLFQEVALALGSTSNTSELLNQILTKIFATFPQTDRGLAMVGDTVETLVPKVVQYRNPSENSRIPVSRTIARKVFLDKQSILINDMLNDGSAFASDTLVQFHHRSVMCAPLIFHQDCLGFIQIDSQGQNRFKREDLSLLTGVAALAAIFLKNERLFRLTNFERYFSQDLAKQIVNGQIDLKPGGDIKHGTVFFSDLVGFTSMSETMNPHETINIMNRYFEIMVNIILKHRGYIDKFIGDAIMAVWGAPIPVQNEALLAITSAIEMQNALYLFNCALAAEGPRNLRMAIGLNSGKFVAGNLGSDRRMEYTVLGDAVNLAQRVESKACVGHVYISENTYERCNREVLACRLKPATVKGKRDEVTIYSVRGVPTQEQGLYIMSLPFFATIEGQQHEGILVKGKLTKSGSVLAQILLPILPKESSLNLIFVPQEAPSFHATFETQREVQLKEPHGKCLNGIMTARSDTMIHELLRDGDHMAPRSPDDMVRSEPFAIWGLQQ